MDLARLTVKLQNCTDRSAVLSREEKEIYILNLRLSKNELSIRNSHLRKKVGELQEREENTQKQLKMYSIARKEAMYKLRHKSHLKSKITQLQDIQKKEIGFRLSNKREKLKSFSTEVVKVKNDFQSAGVAIMISRQNLKKCKNSLEIAEKEANALKKDIKWLNRYLVRNNGKLLIFESKASGPGGASWLVNEKQKVNSTLKTIFNATAKDLKGICKTSAELRVKQESLREEIKLRGEPVEIKEVDFDQLKKEIAEKRQCNRQNNQKEVELFAFIGTAIEGAERIKGRVKKIHKEVALKEKRARMGKRASYGPTFFKANSIRDTTVRFDFNNPDSVQKDCF